MTKLEHDKSWTWPEFCAGCTPHAHQGALSLPSPNCIGERNKDGKLFIGWDKDVYWSTVFLVPQWPQ